MNRELIVVANASVPKTERLVRAKDQFQEASFERILRGTGDGGTREFHRVTADDGLLEALAKNLNEDDDVDVAYIKPEAVPAATPSFEVKQAHLPLTGLGVEHGWRFLGGKGSGVQIIDIETAWELDHEDLQNPRSVLLGGVANPSGISQHGAAVLGVLRGSHNGSGVQGIAPDAAVSVVSSSTTTGGIGTAAAIKLAADNLNVGDVLLLEVQRPGPRHAFGLRDDQLGYIPVEWWPDDYEAIRYATVKGIAVVACGGNGNENLDDPLYDTSPGAASGAFAFGPFPTWWQNPFKRDRCDSGAVIVGAGYTPLGIYYSTPGAPRSRLPFSNYGSCVDVQAWGTGVATTGYGSGQAAFGGGYKGTPETDPNQWYTFSFGGTSAAGALVAGCTALLSGALKGASRPPLIPSMLRLALRSTGQPQQGNPSAPASQRIGNQIDVPSLTGYFGLHLPAPAIESFTAPSIPIARQPEVTAVALTRSQNIVTTAFATDDPFLMRYALAVLGGETNGDEARSASRLLRDAAAVVNADESAARLREFADRLTAALTDLLRLHAQSRHDALLVATAVLGNLAANASTRASELERRVRSVYGAFTAADNIALPDADASYAPIAPGQITPYARAALFEGAGVYRGLHSAYALSLGGDAPELFAAISELALGVIFAREIKNDRLTESFYARRFVLPMLATFSSSSKGDLARYAAGARQIEGAHLFARADQLERIEKLGRA